LAQPPEINETFVREVEENLRRDQMRDFGKKYGGWIVVLVILFLAASGGYIYWQQREQQRSQEQVEELAQVYKTIASNNLTGVPEKLDELAKSRSKAVRASALFTRAAIALDKNDTKLAIAKYQEVANDRRLPRPYRDAALIRQTTLEFDQLKPDEVISRMEPLAKSGGPWFGTAGELTAVALLKQGKRGEAGQLYAAIAKDKSVPDTIRARAAQIASSLGVDVSNALSAPAQ
jgi:hypothetical protein